MTYLFSYTRINKWYGSASSHWLKAAAMANNSGQYDYWMELAFAGRPYDLLYNKDVGEFSLSNAR